MLEGLIVNWNRYLEAANRKVEIAKYHFRFLLDGLQANEVPQDGMPGVPVQAHFEGLVVSVMAAVDQVAQAINSGLRMSLPPDQLVDAAFNEIGEAVPDLKRWYEESIGRDLRRIRTRMIHYSYLKLQGDSGWTVEPVGIDYPGSRELKEYSAEAIRYGERLVATFDALQQRLRATPTEP